MVIYSGNITSLSVEKENLIQITFLDKSQETININLLDQETDLKIRERMLEIIEGLALQEFEDRKSFLDNFKQRDGYNHIWSTPFFEKNYINFPFYKFFKLLVMVELLQRDNRSAEVNISVNEEKHLKQLVKETLFSFDKKMKNLNFFRFILFFFLFGKACVFGFKLYLMTNRYNLRQNGGSKNSQIDNISTQQQSDLYIYSYLNRAFPKSGLFGFESQHWVDLDKLIEFDRFNSIKFMHLGWDDFGKIDISEKLDKIKALTSSKKTSHHLLEAEISFGLLTISILRYFGIAFKNLLTFPKIIEYFVKNSILENIGKLCISDIYSSFLGVGLFRAVLWSEITKKKLGNLNKNSIILYPQENIFWERRVCFEGNVRGLTTIGAPLATVCRWDLRYFNSFLTQNCKALFEPTITAVNGRHAKNNIQKLNFINSRVRVVEAIRFKSLKTSAYKRNSISEIDNLDTLIVGDIDENSTKSLIEIVVNSSIPCETVRFRPHPTQKKINFIGITYLDSRNPLSELVHAYDLIIVSALSSAALEVWLSGKKALFYISPQSLNVSPLIDANVNFFSDSSEFEYFLENIQNTTSNSPKLENFFCLDSKYRRWSKLIRKAK